jgi:signal transduction histidine kinase
MDGVRLGAAVASPVLTRMQGTRLQGLWRPGSRGSLVATVASVSCLAAALALTLFGRDESLGRAVLDALLIAPALAVGLFALRAERTARFGGLLVAAALLWSVALLGDAERSLPYSVGRVAAWCVFPLLVYLMLSFPEGRLTSPRDVRLFRAVTALSLILYLGSVPFIESYPAHSPWVRCDSDCPSNAFLVLSSQPDLIDSLIAPLREGLAAVLFTAVSLALVAKMRSAPTLRRVTLAPVVAVAVLTSLLLVGFLIARNLAPEANVANAIGIAWMLSLPAIAAAYCLGVLQRRLLVGNALTGLGLALNASLAARQLGTVLRSSIGDPRVELLVREPGGGRWLHEDGRPADEELPGPGRVMREIRGPSGPAAAIVLTVDLDADDELVDAIVSLTEAALRESRLQAELDVSRSDLDDSRKRIATAADRERRRIERDLHDGAQQRLIALRMRLSLVEELVLGDPAAEDAIRTLEQDVDRALEEIRSLAHGIYPALLADRGLADALESVARRSPLPVEVSADGLTRLPPEIETAVYFSCIEALQNAIKHGGDATRVRISLHQTALLAFQVIDDGAGFAVAHVRGGTGLANMHDRVESLGGVLTVDSALGQGTVVRGAVPVPVQAVDQPPAAPAPAGEAGAAAERG